MNLVSIALTAMLLQQAAAPVQTQQPIPPPPPPAASAPAPAPAGPDMDTTIKFINDSFAKNGMVTRGKKEKITEQKLTQMAPCEVRFTDKISHDKEDKQDNDILRLDQADPLSTNVEADADHFVVNIKQPIGKKDVKHHVLMGGIYGHFYSKELAERVAHAYIHAIVLCHKDETPSPF
jgi:hypothetical protein